jgi:putative nucleotidyltransferase with HDIG domain
MKRILFVDDEPKVLEGLQRMLRPQRNIWEMAFAQGGEAALTMMEAAPFDVVVSDMRMPRIDGAALLEIVRAKHPNCLRMILSGYTELEAAYRAVPVAHQFLLKPCDSQTLRAAIERGTSLLEVLNSKMLASIVGSLQELPSLPRTYAELRQALSSVETPIDQVVDIVERDVALTAKILQLVNSAFFGVTREVTDIKMAVSFLGMNILQNLVLSVEVLRTFHPLKPIPGFSLEALYAHSHQVAKIAGRIPGSPNFPHAVVVAGLLHDIGKLVIAERAPDHLARAIEGAKVDRRPLFAIEEELIGVSHAEVGAYLLSLWGIPYPIIEAVAHHHHPERVPQDRLDVISVVHFANLLAHEHAGEAQSDSAAAHPLIDTELVEKLGVADQLPEWHSIAESVTHELQEANHG